MLLNVIIPITLALVFFIMIIAIKECITKQAEKKKKGRHERKQQIGSWWSYIEH